MSEDHMERLVGLLKKSAVVILCVLNLPFFLIRIALTLHIEKYKAQFSAFVFFLKQHNTPLIVFTESLSNVCIMFPHQNL